VSTGTIRRHRDHAIGGEEYTGEGVTTSDDLDPEAIDEAEAEQPDTLPAEEVEAIDEQTAALVAEGEQDEPGVPAGTDDTADESEAVTGAPAGNASTEEWRDYALGNGFSEGDLEGLGRDAIRDLFA
jgi:hypothetical protein